MSELSDRVELLDFWCEQMFRALADTDPAFRRRFFENVRADIKELREELGDELAAKAAEGYLLRFENIPESMMG